MDKEIKFNITLGEDNMPERIVWNASDSGNEGQECKSVMISMWDGQENTTLRFDLWTKDMRVDEMHNQFMQTLILLSETYQRATQNDMVVDEMKRFCQSLDEKITAYEEAKKKNN